jgi:hypothetical protein
MPKNPKLRESQILYKIPKDEYDLIPFDNVLKIGNGFKKATDYINSHYGNTIECDVILFNDELRVYFIEKQEGVMKTVIKDYLSRAPGRPYLCLFRS